MCVTTHTTLLRGLNPQPENRQRRQADPTQLPRQGPCNATTPAGPARSHSSPHNTCQEGVSLFHLTPYPWTMELTITGTRITFGRRTWRAKWSHAEEYIQGRQLRVQVQCQLLVELWVSRSPRWAGNESLHNTRHRDLWHSQLMDIQRYSRSQGLRWKPPDFQTHAVRDVKAHSLLCSASLPRRTSSSCYFGFAPQLNFKDLDVWDIYGKAGAEAVRKPCLTVKWGARWESIEAPLGHWSYCYKKTSVPAQVVKCDWMAKQESFFNSCRV